MANRAGLLLFGLLVGLTASHAVAQRTRESPGGGYFGAPVLEYTRLRGQGALMLGGRGGWYITPSLVLGAGLYGTVTEVDAPSAAVGPGLGPLDLKLETFGAELEYHVRPAAPTHLTLGALLGGGAAHYMRDGTDEQEGETDFLFLVAPAVGVEQSVATRLHIHLAVSYRLTGGAEQVGLKERHLRGPAVALALKIGRF